MLEPSYPREQPVLRPDHPGGPDLASSTPLDSSPVAEWDLLAALLNMDLARPDPAVWAAGGAELTNFSTDSVQPRVPSASPIQAPPGAAIARPFANRLPHATGLPSALCFTTLLCTVLYCTVPRCMLVAQVAWEPCGFCRRVAGLGREAFQFYLYLPSNR